MPIHKKWHVMIIMTVFQIFIPLFVYIDRYVMHMNMQHLCVCVCIQERGSQFGDCNISNNFNIFQLDRRSTTGNTWSYQPPPPPVITEQPKAQHFQPYDKAYPKTLESLAEKVRVSKIHQTPNCLAQGFWIHILMYTSVLYYLLTQLQLSIFYCQTSNS